MKPSTWFSFFPVPPSYSRYSHSSGEIEDYDAEDYQKGKTQNVYTYYKMLYKRTDSMEEVTWWGIIPVRTRNTQSTTLIASLLIPVRFNGTMWSIHVGHRHTDKNNTDSNITQNIATDTMEWKTFLILKYIMLQWTGVLCSPKCFQELFLYWIKGTTVYF